jgi:dTDP-glucose pyrophosphorylase
MRPLPEHGCCLVCGTENPHSFGIQRFISKEGEKTVKAKGQIRLPDGNLAVTACGIYVYTPQLFGKLLD